MIKLYCYKGLLRHRKKVEDIAASENGKKIIEAAKNIIDRKKDDPYATDSEISRESGVEESLVRDCTKFLFENGIFCREPLRKTMSGRKVSEWKYGLRKKEIEISKGAITPPKIDKTNGYVV